MEALMTHRCSKWKSLTKHLTKKRENLKTHGFILDGEFKFKHPG